MVLQRCWVERYLGEYMTHEQPSCLYVSAAHNVRDLGDSARWFGGVRCCSLAGSLTLTYTIPLTPARRPTRPEYIL